MMRVASAGLGAACTVGLAGANSYGANGGKLSQTVAGVVGVGILCGFGGTVGLDKVENMSPASDGDFATLRRLIGGFPQGEQACALQRLIDGEIRTTRGAKLKVQFSESGMRSFTDYMNQLTSQQ